MLKEVAQLMKDEGFWGYPYHCTEGFLTVGHGFNIQPGYVHPIVAEYLEDVVYPITPMYSQMILTALVKEILDRVLTRYPYHPIEVIRILTNMQYQLGEAGVNRFLKMHAAIREHEYQRAAAEMLDSRWARQTPNRARRLAERMANI